MVPRPPIYRADGLRNSKETAEGKTTHLWDGSNIVAELNGNTVTSRYVRGIGLILSDSAEGQKFYLYNGHGDVVQLADTSGNIVKTYDYDAFGNEREIAGQDASLDTNPFRYCGEYFDVGSGTYYLRARYYQPTTGRFLTEDPLRSGWNWYAYCGNSPILYIDPLGLAFIPLRITAEGDGYTIGWNASTRTATVYGGWDGPVKFQDKTGDTGQKTYINERGIMMVWDETYYYCTMLTAADKVASVRVASVDGSWYKDYSNPVNTALKNAEPDFKNHSNELTWFKKQVDHNANWDIKREDPWNKTIAKDTFPGSYNTVIVINGALTTPEELGNMTYGYLGTACGFSQFVLLAGGDYAAGGVKGVFTQADSTEDKAAIRQGIQWYKNR